MQKSGSKKILHVINALVVAGAEKVASSIALEQAKHHSVTVFSIVSVNQIFNKQQAELVNLRFGKNTTSFFNVHNLKLLHALIKKHDVIHVHLFPSFYLVALVGFFFRNKSFVYTEHSSFNKRRKFFYKPLEKLIYSQYNCITCVSQGVYDSLLKWMGPKLPATIIPNFYNQEEINQQKPFPKTELGFKESDKLMVMVGSFRSDKSKDQKSLIHAVAKLPEHFKLLFLGEGTTLENNKKVAEELNVAHRVFFMGLRLDLFSILKACDYAILSSRWEGFPVALLEYMACEKVALATDVPGIKEIMPFKENLFELGNTKQLIEHIYYFENHPEAKEETIKNQLEFIKDYQLESIIEQYENIY